VAKDISRGNGEEGGKQYLEIVLRARDGITKALLEKAASAQTKGETTPVAVFVDGPYGHSGLANDLRRFDRVLFLAGGSGM
jgi:NAD(P)H-flavin reductase